MKNFDQLYSELSAKVQADDKTSSTVQAIDRGVHYLGKKILEEAGEVWIAAEYQSDQELAEEISQLLYWLQTLMLQRNITIEQVYDFL